VPTTEIACWSCSKRCQERFIERPDAFPVAAGTYG
jgi:hypothetical protein